MVLWLDLANTYGLLPHKLVDETFMKYYVPAGTRNIILDYSDFQMRFTLGSITNWTLGRHKLEVGIITDCSLCDSFHPGNEHAGEISRT